LTPAFGSKLALFQQSKLLLWNKKDVTLGRSLFEKRVKFVLQARFVADLPDLQHHQENRSRLGQAQRWKSHTLHLGLTRKKNGH
jgi:hypothetical protein